MWRAPYASSPPRTARSRRWPTHNSCEAAPAVSVSQSNLWRLQAGRRKPRRELVSGTKSGRRRHQLIEDRAVKQGDGEIGQLAQMRKCGQVRAAPGPALGGPIDEFAQR